MGTGKTVSVDDMKEAFCALIEGRLSREEVAKWASRLMRLSDSSELEYLPPEHEDLIWESITYLVGADLREEPTKYLHGTEDFEEFYQKLHEK